MSEEKKKYRDPRAEKLRARGMVGNASVRAQPGNEALRRARVARRQGALGVTLSEQVRKRVRAQPGTDSRLAHPALAGAAFSASLAVVGFMVDGFIAMVVLAAGGFVIGVFLLTLTNRNRGVRNAEAEIASADEFDVFVTARCTRLPDAAITSLGEMKTLFARLFPALRSVKAIGAFGVDDVFFIHQAVKRYLPDAIDPYLALPTPADSARLAMQEQLDLVTRKLRMLSDRLDDVHVQELLRNRNFLVRKLDV